jgi:hypothetical protein
MNKTKTGPGFIVELQDGRKARTFNSDIQINKKTQIYLAKAEKNGIPTEYEDKASLVSNAKVIGFID